MKKRAVALALICLVGMAGCIGGGPAPLEGVSEQVGHGRFDLMEGSHWFVIRTTVLAEYAEDVGSGHVQRVAIAADSLAISDFSVILGFEVVDGEFSPLEPLLNAGGEYQWSSAGARDIDLIVVVAYEGLARQASMSLSRGGVDGGDAALDAEVIANGSQHQLAVFRETPELTLSYGVDVKDERPSAAMGLHLPGALNVRANHGVESLHYARVALGAATGGQRFADWVWEFESADVKIKQSGNAIRQFTSNPAGSRGLWWGEGAFSCLHVEAPAGDASPITVFDLYSVPWNPHEFGFRLPEPTSSSSSAAPSALGSAQHCDRS